MGTDYASRDSNAACIGAMEMSLDHGVGCLLHVSQILEVIYVDGAKRTAAAKVTPFTSQHASELKC